MFERFHQDARRAVGRAQREAVHAGQGRIGCEHLLLGLLAEPGPAAAALTAAGLELTTLRNRLPRGPLAEPDPLDADALASIGIDLDQVRRAAEATFGAGALDRAGSTRARRPGLMPLAAETKKALELAIRTTQRLRHREITGAHLLIGIIDQGHNGALSLLAESGIDPGGLRADVLGRLAAAA